MPLAWSKRAVKRLRTKDRSAALSRNAGIGLMVTAMFLAPGMDALAKILSAHVTGAQVAMIRFGMQALFLFPFVVLMLGFKGLRPQNLPLSIFRGILVACAVSSFFTALKWMPLADAIAVFFVEPLILTVFSAVFLKEHVGPRRYAAVAIGLAGALIVIRPSFDQFGIVALFPLLTATLFASYLILTSKLARNEHPLTLQFTAGVSGFAFMAVLMSVSTAGHIPLLSLVWPNDAEWLILFAVGAIGTASHLMIVYAFKAAPASLLAPFHYLEIVAATVFGYLVFGEFPDALKWFGILIIVASGLYVIWRER